MFDLRGRTASFPRGGVGAKLYTRPSLWRIRSLSSVALLAVVAVVACTTALACGSDGDAPGGGSSGTPTTPPTGTTPPGTTPALERRDLPLGTPSLGGFQLVDAFPGVKTSIPSALVWPKVDGAAPFLLERTGYVKQLTGGTARTVLDFYSSVVIVSESGALGMALHPMFGDGTGPSPYAYFWYNAKGDPKNKQRLSRFTWMPATQVFDRASELVLLEEEEERPEHNGGRIQFGPDGFLYFGNGDDSSSANHQRIDRALFAGIFRIDVDSRGGAISHAPPKQPEGGQSQGYFIPNDNPFVGSAGAMEEYYALGLRNPFAFSFDRKTGALWAADVGETFREEVNQVVAGGNYEWPYREGELMVGTTPPSLGKSGPPKYGYSHHEMADLVAVLGGFVYRGTELPELAGKYIFSDWPSCRIWALDFATSPPTRTTLIDREWNRVPMAIAEDNKGEVYLLHFNGVAKLARDTSRDQVPKRLSETKLFADVAGLKPEPALVPYEINSPLWSDGAAKQRWINLPRGKQVELAADGALKFPIGTTFVKHFELPMSVMPRGRTRRLETRVLVVGTETVYGLTYRWNAQGTDADLVTEPADEGIMDDAAKESRSWHYPSFGQCWSCHRTENRILGFTPQQLNLKSADGKEQLVALAGRGVFSQAAIAMMPPGLARPSDTAASLEARATAYLAANCSSCHHDGASFLGGENTWKAEPGVALAERGLVGAPHHNTPMAKALNLRFAPLIDPGNPDGSILMGRMKSANPDLRMPPLARNVVDRDGSLLIERWIRSLPPGG